MKKPKSTARDARFKAPTQDRAQSRALFSSDLMLALLKESAAKPGRKFLATDPASTVFSGVAYILLAPGEHRLHGLVDDFDIRGFGGEPLSAGWRLYVMERSLVTDYFTQMGAPKAAHAVRTVELIPVIIARGDDAQVFMTNIDLVDLSRIRPETTDGSSTESFCGEHA